MESIRLQEPGDESPAADNEPSKSTTTTTGQKQQPSDVAAVERLREEVDDFYSRMRLFPQMEQAEIYMDLAAMSARCSEIRSRVVRTRSQRLNAFRTKELDPLLDELDRQFRTWSRLATVRAQEWDMAGKAV